jgi:F0F1-type ATP synthase assembly protein I
MSKLAEQLQLRSEPRKQQAMKRPKEQARDQKRRGVFWLKTLLIAALVVGAGLGFLRTLIAIITLD